MGDFVELNIVFVVEGGSLSRSTWGLREMRPILQKDKSTMDFLNACF